MFKKSFVSTLFLFMACMAMAQNGDFLQYIEQYKKIAVKEMDRAGIPASIKLAQALLESNAGKSELARKANNHFGIKCGTDWKGKTYEIEDDDYDEYGNIVKSCFRKYKSEEESFIGHSEFLRDPKKANRYGFLFRLEPTDYKRWAKGLRTSGYATGAGYDEKLIRIIETYKLYELDDLDSDNFPEGRPDNIKDAIAGLDLRKVNDVKVVFAKNRITVQDISEKTGVSISRLKRYNEILPAPNDSLKDDTRIYIQPKRCRNRGGRKWHYVQPDETLFAISQLYGIKLSKIRSRNRIPEGAELQVNQPIKLKGCRIKEGERPRLETEKKPTETVPPLLDPDDEFMPDEITPEKPTTAPPSGGTTKPTTPPTGGTTKPTTPPTGGTRPDTSTPTTPSTQPAEPGDGFHTVAKGDTLYNISRRYSLTVDELLRLNSLSDSNIKIGQVLRVK